MDVSIVTIGDEILIGQIIDTNSAWIAREFNLIGAHINRIISIGDDKEDIIHALEQTTKESDIVLLTGGLGPTKDDITKVAIASFLDVGMEFHTPTYEKIIQLFEKWGRPPTQAHKEQCYLPKGVEILKNNMGTAPGMWFEYQGKVIVSMPGVPYEMKYIVTNSLIPKLKKKFKGKPIAHRTILTVGEGESRIAERIASFEESLPNHIKLAFLPSLGKVRLRLTAKGDSEATINKELDQLVSELDAIIPDLIFGYEAIPLEEAVGQLLFEKGLKLSTAESCTGGLLAHKLITIPGASRYILGSCVAYDNAIKSNVLGVSEKTLGSFGAVSEQTVKEMVIGANKLFQSDLAIAISGIAGPDGGTKEKPVGTVWLAIGNEKIQKTRKLQIGKDRLKNIEYSVVQALNFIRQFVTQHYFS